jgi:hypothetical protein
VLDPPATGEDEVDVESIDTGQNHAEFDSRLALFEIRYPLA